MAKEGRKKERKRELSERKTLCLNLFSFKQREEREGVVRDTCFWSSSLGNGETEKRTAGKGLGELRMGPRLLGKQR